MTSSHTVDTEEVSYPSGQSVVPARLYRHGAACGAGIVVCAGRLRDIDGLDFLSRALAEAGYVVLAIRYRGMDFDTDDADALAGLDYLQSLQGITATRPLGVAGHSRGGMTALRLAAQDSRVRSVVALAPPTDMTRYMRAMELLSPARYSALAGTMGTPEERPDRYRRLSALRYADAIRVPVLLVCGTQDLHAPLDHSQWMKDALTAGGNQRVRLEVLDGVGHFFERMYFGYEFDRVSRLTVDWFASTLASE